MTTQDLLLKIIARCKASVTLTVNDHICSHQSVAEEIETYLSTGPDRLSSFLEGQKTIEECIEKDTLLCLDFYPDTPGGFYTIYHWDLEAILKEACEILEIPLE
jgi:molybdopterin-guanine dinucleotide biosynthesis protein A